MKTKLERMAAVIEDTIEKLLKHTGDDKNIYIYRYNFWIWQFEDEVLKDMTIDTARLNVSKFMEGIITSWIYRQQRIQSINDSYRGFTRDGDKYRRREIEKLFKI